MNPYWYGWKKIDNIKDRFRFGHQGITSWLCRAASLHATVIPESGSNWKWQGWRKIKWAWGSWRCMCGRVGSNNFGSSKEYS